MRAIGKYIIVEESKENIKKTSGGLELLDKHDDDIKYKEAVVISAGTDVSGVGEGDKVLFSKVAGNGIEFEGNLLKVIQERDVVVVL